MSKSWERIEKKPICCRCGKEAEYFFKEKGIFLYSKKTYCKEHLLKKIEEEHLD